MQRLLGAHFHINSIIYEEAINRNNAKSYMMQPKIWEGFVVLFLLTEDQAHLKVVDFSNAQNVVIFS